jgi:uncharacterized protein with LGFP repeats
MTRVWSRTSLIAVVAIIAALLMAVTPSPAAEAADARTFNAGNIVSDANFYNSNAMTAGDVQAFLNAKGAGCSTRCLKSYAMETVAKPAQAGLCNGYAGGLVQTAAQIIDGVARSCGVSQKTLLVLLQKEQSLVTINNPDDYRYRAAMGQGCPDTAPCDAQFYGFFNQVYGAARQFKVYRLYPDSFWYKAGRVNSILYHPNEACGRTSVYIENQATAGLYIYTPYTPNAAALNAQWGLGDGCSSYGNRNFFLYWSEWFGNPQIAGPESDIAFVRSTYPSLGDARENVTCGLVGGGCRQIFANGAVFWTSSAGAKKVDGGIWGLYQQAGAHAGYLGYPLDTATWSDVNGGGWVQRFQNGAAYWSNAGGGRLVSSTIYREYLRVGGPGGDVGWPLGDQGCGLARGACVQAFQYGDVYWTSGAGAIAVRGGMRESLIAMGGVTGALGYPVGTEQYRAAHGGWVQAFEGGDVYWRNGNGIHMFGGIRAEYLRAGDSGGYLGWPTTAQTCVPDGCRQDFTAGSILWTGAAGSFVVSGGIHETYSPSGAEKGILGYPVGVQTFRPGNGDGWSQAFQRGSIYWRNGAGFVMYGGIRDEYARQNYNAGPLGWPTGPQLCGLSQGGCSQTFDGGSIYWSPTTGTAVVRAGSLLAAYLGASGPAGPLGYPLSAAVARTGNGSGVVQEFQTGAIYKRDGADAHAMYGPIRQEYARQNYNWGTLGWPVSGVVCGLSAGGCRQQFQTGWIVWSQASGAVRIDGGLWETWTALGGEAGRLGYPTGPAVVRSAGGWTQPFQFGRLSWAGDRGGFVE